MLDNPVNDFVQNEDQVKEVRRLFGENEALNAWWNAMRNGCMFHRLAALDHKDVGASSYIRGYSHALMDAETILQPKPEPQENEGLPDLGPGELRPV